MFRYSIYPLLLLLATVAAAAPLDPLISDVALWSMNQADFEKSAQGLGFRWVSQAHDSARSAGGGLTVFGLPAVEAIARFDKDKVKEFTVAIYARGDAGDLT